MNALAEALADLESVQEVLTLAETARVKALAARDALVHDLRAGGFTAKETGALLGISKQRVSQIERAGWAGCAAADSSGQAGGCAGSLPGSEVRSETTGGAARYGLQD